MNKIEFQEYTRENGTRIYVKEEKHYVSLTTLLSKYEDKTVLHKWKDKVGHEEAKNICLTAADRGKAAHSQIEHFYGLYDEPCEEYNRYADVAIKKFYSHVEPVELENVVFYEHPSGAKLAGRYDALLSMPPNVFRYKEDGEFVLGGKLIADLKTKDKPPRLDKIDFIFKHILQIAAYSKMLTLTTDHVVNSAAIVYAVVLKTKEHCKVLYLDAEKIDFFWCFVKELLLDFYKIRPLKNSWGDMIGITHCHYDINNEMLVDHCPREIYIDEFLSNSRLSSSTSEIRQP